MIALIVRLTAKPGKPDELEQALVTLARDSREESGCETFVALREVHAPERFVLFEQWSDESAFAAHQSGAAVRHVRGLLPDLVQGDPNVSQLETLSHPVSQHE